MVFKEFWQCPVYVFECFEKWNVLKWTVVASELKLKNETITKIKHKTKKKHCWWCNQMVQWQCGYQVWSFEVEDDVECLSLKRPRIMRTLTRATDTMTNSCRPDQKLTRSKLYSWMLRSRSSTCENARCNSTDLRKLLLTWCVDVCNTQQISYNK